MCLQNIFDSRTCVYKLQAGQMTGSIISKPEFSLPHAHLCERAMPSALGSDLEAGRFHRTVSGSGMVMSPTQAFESSISRVSHHAPHVSVRRGHSGPLRTQEVRDPGSSGIRETGKAPAFGRVCTPYECLGW